MEVFMRKIFEKRKFHASSIYMFTKIKFLNGVWLFIFEISCIEKYIKIFREKNSLENVHVKNLFERNVNVIQLSKKRIFVQWNQLRQTLNNVLLNHIVKDSIPQTILVQIGKNRFNDECLTLDICLEWTNEGWYEVECEMSENSRWKLVFNVFDAMRFKIDLLV